MLIAYRIILSAALLLVVANLWAECMPAYHKGTTTRRPARGPRSRDPWRGMSNGRRTGSGGEEAQQGGGDQGVDSSTEESIHEVITGFLNGNPMILGDMRESRVLDEKLAQKMIDAAHYAHPMDFARDEKEVDLLALNFYASDMNFVKRLKKGLADVKDKCAICAKDLDPIKEYQLDCCNHKFCIDCIRRRNQMSLSRHWFCPECRSKTLRTPAPLIATDS